MRKNGIFRTNTQRRLAQRLWLLLFLLPLALFVVGLVPFFRSQQAISTGYALYVVALDVLLMGSFALVALLIFWRRPASWAWSSLKPTTWKKRPKGCASWANALCPTPTSSAS